MKNLFTEYGSKARLIPALLCLPPFLILKHFAIDPYVGFSWWTQLSAIVIEDISIGMAIVFLLTQINRIISKFLFEEKTSFPTDLALLPSSTDLSDEFRRKLNVKIQKDFNLTVPSLLEENTDLPQTKRRIREIVSCMVNRVRDGRLLLQFNIEYGFARNFFGGAVLATVISFLCVVLFSHVILNEKALGISLTLGFLYLIALMSAKPILKHYGKEYSEVLFREYLENN